jgi:predicted TIM-barrel enzyme
MLKIDRKIFAAHMQIGVMGAVAGRAATSLAKSAQRASLTSAVEAYQKTSICAPKALANRRQSR